MAVAVSGVAGRAVPRADKQTIALYAEKLVAKPTGSRVLALAADPAYDGPATVQVGATTVQVRGCVSGLAVRDFLTDLGPEDYAIILTDWSSEELGDSVLARLRRHRVEPLDRWSTVPSMFGARTFDPALRSQLPWLPGVLSDLRPLGGYPPSRSGTVTGADALDAVAQAVFGMDGSEIGLYRLLVQVSDMGVRRQWAKLDPAARAHLQDWAAVRIGPEAGAALLLLDNQETAKVHVLAMGLVLDVLYGEDGGDTADARARWEQAYGLPRIPAAAAAGLGAAALDVLSGATVGRQRRDEVLADAPAAFRIAEFSLGLIRSRIHPQGYTARLRALGEAISERLDDLQDGAGRRSDAGRQHVLAVEARLRAVEGHLCSSLDAGLQAETQRATMAVRLVRWLGVARAEDPGSTPATLDAALTRQVAVDGWVDRALADVWSGTDDEDLAEVYGRVCAAVQRERARHDAEFARTLAVESARGDGCGDALPVEAVLARVVEPLREVSRVLVIVVDGMSAAVAAALAEGLLGRGWAEFVEDRRTARRGVLAALPTLTRYSRTSLLCGELRDGDQAVEKRAFTSRRAELLHKDDLRTKGGHGSGSPLRGRLKNGPSVLGVVLNTVDDTLAKHDPDGTRWSIDSVQHLASLVDTAREAGRIVILVSDHGHVVERGSRSEPGEGRETRWRPESTGPVTADEVLLAGPRVLAGELGADGTRSIIAPWVEGLRYGAKQAGYHGGASPAEVSIPLLVFAHPDADLSAAGWTRADVQTPRWWDLAEVTSDPEPAGRAPAPKRAAVPVFDGDALFDDEDDEDETASGASPAASADVVDRFLASDGYRAARSRSGRIPLEDEVVARALRALLQAGGRAPVATIAAICSPRGGRAALSPLKRVMSMDGYPALTEIDNNRTLVLDEALWRKQFGLGMR